MSDKRHKWRGGWWQECSVCRQERKRARVFRGTGGSGSSFWKMVWLYRYGLEWMTERKVPPCGGAR